MELARSAAGAVRNAAIANLMCALGCLRAITRGRQGGLAIAEAIGECSGNPALLPRLQRLSGKTDRNADGFHNHQCRSAISGYFGLP